MKLAPMIRFYTILLLQTWALNANSAPNQCSSLFSAKGSQPVIGLNLHDGSSRGIKALWKSSLSDRMRETIEAVALKTLSKDLPPADRNVYIDIVATWGRPEFSSLKVAKVRLTDSEGKSVEVILEVTRKSLSPSNPGDFGAATEKPKDLGVQIGTAIGDAINNLALLKNPKLLLRETRMMDQNLRRLDIIIGQRAFETSYKARASIRLIRKELAANNVEQGWFESDVKYIGRVFSAQMRAKEMFAEAVGEISEGERLASVRKVEAVHEQKKSDKSKPNDTTDSGTEMLTTYAWVTDPMFMLSHPWYWGSKDGSFWSIMLMHDLMANHATKSENQRSLEAKSPTAAAAEIWRKDDVSPSSSASETSTWFTSTPDHTKMYWQEHMFDRPDAGSLAAFSERMGLTDDPSANRSRTPDNTISTGSSKDTGAIAEGDRATSADAGTEDKTPFFSGSGNEASKTTSSDDRPSRSDWSSSSEPSRNSESDSGSSSSSSTDYSSPSSDSGSSSTGD
jgi:hypothetical protein